jgi:hypothetical protein
MKRITQPATALLLALAATALSGCGSAPKGSVSEEELGTIRTTSHSISPGQKKADVLAKYQGANVVRLSTAQVDGATIEEWKAEAFHDSDKGRDLSVQFLYFRNDVLVDMSDTRLNFRGDSALTKRWAGVGG